jgi:hypothetical protein
MPQPHRATGAFDVSMQPQPDDSPAAADAPPPETGHTLGRFWLDKRYHGDLQALGQGRMLSAITATAGSAGYVALEQVSGTLQGRAGSFVLQHCGLMNRGARQLSITVVPDSGTGALAGLAGRMDIRIVEGRHFYDLDYTLPPA